MGLQLDTLTSMDAQMVLNIIFSGVSFISGWVMKVLWEAFRDLQRADKDIAHEVNSMKVLVVGEYVRKEFFEAKMDSISIKLDRIFDKLDSKQDK